MPESLTFCGRTFSASGGGVDARHRGGVFRPGSDGDRAYRLRVAGLETAQWRAEESRVPATAGAPRGREGVGLVQLLRSAEEGGSK